MCYECPRGTVPHADRMAEMPNGTPVEAYRNLLPDKWTKKEQSK